MLGMNPHIHRCCQHNGGHGWPYFNHHLWYATAGDGLAAYLYAPCTVTAKVAGGVEVTVEERTKYPFEEAIEFHVKPARSVKFPLHLRIPAWCEKASVSVNGTAADEELPAGKVARIDREWKAGDVVKLSLPMPVKAKTWDGNNTVSVVRGPLTYSLEIKEKYARYAGTDQWPAFDILPDSPWNYGLELKLLNPSNALTVEKNGWPADDRPFTKNSPVRIKAPARRIPAWTLDRRGLVNEVAPGPIKSSEPVEEITLIPMGAARLQITAFPRIDNAQGKDWPPPPRPKYLATASHCWDGDSLDAMCDNVVPKHSNDQSIDRFTWWPRKGSTEWAQFDFDQPIHLSSAAVYWFDDTPTRGGCKLPKSWRLLYRDGKEWKPVPEATEYPVAKDRFCEVKFKPITTAALRLEAQLEAGYSGGILEWRVK